MSSDVRLAQCHIYRSCWCRRSLCRCLSFCISPRCLRRVILPQREGVETMEEIQKTYLPAAGHDWMLPLYDPLVKLLGGDRARRALLDQALIRPGHRILDIGCGTGTLVVLLKCLHPGVEGIGLDPDPKALARAR